MIRIRWHGHSCFEIGDHLTIVTDPHDGKSIGIEPPRVRGDIILITHSHYDHDKSRVVEKFDSTVVKEEVGELEAKGVKIEGYETYHDDVGGEKRGRNVVYKFELEDISFCHLGDIGHIPQRDVIEKIRGVDILFIPVGGVFTIDARRAWEIVEIIKPKIAIPMHYRVSGLSIPLANLNQFTRGHEDQVANVGNEINIEKEDLSNQFELWVFSPD